MARRKSELEFDDLEANSGSIVSPKKERPPEQLAEMKAMEFLARREHSRAELEEKLGKREFSDEAIAIAIDSLAERGWQSDERFAELFIEQRANRGKGPRLVRHELTRRGIASSLASTAMRDTEVVWEEVAIRTVARKFRLDADYAKMRRFLEQRGFDSAMARIAIKHLQQPYLDD